MVIRNGNDITLESHFNTPSTAILTYPYQRMYPRRILIRSRSIRWQARQKGRVIGLAWRKTLPGGGGGESKDHSKRLDHAYQLGSATNNL
jgi:hypothetical protein